MTQVRGALWYGDTFPAQAENMGKTQEVKFLVLFRPEESHVKEGKIQTDQTMQKNRLNELKLSLLILIITWLI